MNEISTYLGEIDMEGSFLSNRLIISRHLGTRHVMPALARWAVKTDKKSDCWRCNQHILTIFLWTPRIGALTGEKNEEKIRYYKKQIESFRDTDKSLPTNDSETPLICGSFNDWRYEKMQEVVKFCSDFDYQRPDFIKICVDEGLIKEKVAKNGKFNSEQRKIIENQE